MAMFSKPMGPPMAAGHPLGAPVGGAPLGKMMAQANAQAARQAAQGQVDQAGSLRDQMRGAAPGISPVSNEEHMREMAMRGADPGPGAAMANLGSALAGPGLGRINPADMARVDAQAKMAPGAITGVNLGGDQRTQAEMMGQQNTSDMRDPRAMADIAAMRRIGGAAGPFMRTPKQVLPAPNLAAAAAAPRFRDGGGFGPMQRTMQPTMRPQLQQQAQMGNMLSGLNGR